VGTLGVAVVGSTLAISQRQSDYAFLDELIEIKQIIQSRYVTEPDLNKLRQGAIKGMVEALDDPYTVYVPPVEKGEFNKNLLGEYVGIGAQVNTQDGWLTIVSPLEDSPAYRAGLMAEDRVAEIDGKSTQGLSSDQCVDLLVGEPGTKVKLTIERKGQRLEVEIVRAAIKTRSVKGFHRDDADGETWQYLIDPQNRIAYVRLTQFTPQCSDEIEAALASVGADKGQLGGLILDLRFNPGGVLREAEAIADLFLKEGVIVSTRGRAFEEKISRATAGGTLPDFPIILLVNGQSASASEVLAGALTENNRAIVLGSRSFGKGTVQTVLEPPSGKGSEIKITEQGYYLPSGRSITRKDDSPTWGVDPTEGFYLPTTDKDVGEMLDARRKEEVLRVSGSKTDTSERGNWSDPAWVLEHLKDKHLSAAVRAMQARITGGSWVPVGEKGPTGLQVSVDELQKARQYRDRLERELFRIDKRVSALEDASGDAGKAASNRDLWADTLDLTGGVMEIRDKDGKVVTILDITGNNLERWLVDADVKKKDEKKADDK
jgi:carboxyl-terminal processing protease